MSYWLRARISGGKRLRIRLNVSFAQVDHGLVASVIYMD